MLARMHTRRVCALTVFLVFMSWHTVASAKQSWSVWIQQLRTEALSEGISPDVFDAAFAGVTPMRRVISLDRGQPERRLTYLKYRSTRAKAYRINLGKRKFKKYGPKLRNIGREYGVDPCIIASLWGLESSYGHYMGHFPVIRALATLAYDDRRAAFFRKELLLALHILNDGHVTLAKFKGEWAGGSGHPQFLPSSWHRYAVDYDKDGRKDIWGTHDDVFASIANYLASNGWTQGQPWGLEVYLPDGFDESQIGYDTKKPLSAWIAQGVTPLRGRSFPKTDWEASILQPYGGPALLVFDNFRVILRYNRSTFYAGTVSYMADKICRRW